MKQFILITAILLMFILAGCAQTETQKISAPVNEAPKTTVAEPAKTEPAPQTVAKQAPAPVKPVQPSTVELNLSEGNKTVGYLPNYTVIHSLVKGNSVNFNQSGVEILGVYKNAISVRVKGTILGETFTVAKGAPVDVNTRDGKLRMDFSDNNVLYVQKAE